MATTKNSNPRRYKVVAAANQERHKAQDRELQSDASLGASPKGWTGHGLFPDEVSGLPSEIARSALFGLPRRGRRKFRRREVIFSSSDTVIRYSGEQLDQGDLEVWLLLVMVAQGQDLDKMLHLRTGPMLRALKRNDKGNSRKALRASLSRLVECSLHIQYRRDGKNRGGGFNFLEGFAIDEDTKEIATKIGETMYKLFSGGFTSLIAFEQHVSLESNMAKAIHKYAAGHKRGQAHGVPLDRLKLLLGYEGEMRKFRTALLEGLKQLESERILESPRITRENIVRWKMNKFKLYLHGVSDNN